MIKEAGIIRPSRLRELQQPVMFIPANSKDQLIELDLGFTANPVFKQEKLCCFLPENIYYQKLTLVDGRNNFIKDDIRSIVIAGEFENTNLLQFEIEIYPRLPETALDTSLLLLPFYPETGVEIILKDQGVNNIFYHLSCTKIIYKAGGISRLQFRHLGNYSKASLSNVFSKWHKEAVTLPSQLD